MDGIKTLLAMENKSHILLILILILVAVVFLVENIQKLKNMFGIKTKWDTREENEEKAIKELETEVDTLTKDFIQDCKNRDQFEMDTVKTLNDLKEGLSNLQDSVQVMQDKLDASARARLKDRISQSHKYYRKLKKWTSMEKEAYLDLITSYEQNGGANSFIHSVCLPECQTWEVIDDDF